MRRRPVLIDTHVHLDAAEFDDDREQVIARARAAGVGRFVVPAVERRGFDAVERLADDHRGIVHALGIHPLYTMRAAREDLELLDQRLNRGRAIAVGEIGLDHYVTDVDRGVQLEFFTAQLRLAARHGLPVILHVRRAIDPILAQLRRIPVPGGIAHAFNGSRQQADILIGRGFKLGFGGSMSYGGSTRIRELAASLPLEAIVLETDAPDIAPEWARGRRNEPANLARYAGILAELRGMAPEEVADVTTANAIQVLHWPPLEEE